MNAQHLSDEAVAAFADGVLSGHARDRAARHASRCPECAHAVAVQREAVWALRAAPAPALPNGLLDRLRAVPVTTPVATPTPSAVDDDGSALFATFAPMAAFVPAQPGVRTESHRLRPIAITAAAVAAAGLLAVGSDVSSANTTTTTPPPSGQLVGFVQNSGAGQGATMVPANARLRVGP